MAKKRKGGSSAGPSAPAAEENGRTRMHIKDYEDVAGSDDEFHINRDKILLDEGPDAKRRKQWQEQDEFLEPSDEEVLDYTEPSDADNDDDDDDDATTRAKPTHGEDSDEGEAEDEDEDTGAWGSSKQDYYDADVLETEQDALDEEAEAMRIQKKQLQGMTAADYGFDESEWQDGDANGNSLKEQEEQAVVTEVLPQMQISEDTGPIERLKMLKTRYPEFEPLSRDFLALEEQFESLAAAALDAETRLARLMQPTHISPVAVTKHRAAAAYLASLTMYFALLTSTADDSKTNGLALSAATIHDHPVMDSLVKCRDLWARVRHLPTDDLPEERSSSPAEHIRRAMQPVDDAKSEAMVLDAPRAKKSKAQKSAEAAKTAADARRADRMAKTEADLADLDLLIRGPAHARKSKPTPTLATTSDNPATNDVDSDFGEESTLTAHEQAEKAQRKKSLRFYTSQIAQKANKRGAAGRHAGGDDDIPHRERLRDRQARLTAEAEARGRKAGAATAVGGGDDLGNSSADEDDTRVATELRAGEDDSAYYDMIASRSAGKKSEKRALAALTAEAAKSGGQVVQREEVGADGKRAISYLIEKNKGLTPHRKKDVRNPRVKKRKKYEDKKKKLASMKPTYKGGEGRGGYKGEMTGIKSGLVRSTKL